MSNIVPFKPQGQMSTAVQQYVQQHGADTDAFSQGIGGSFANVSFKGKVFRVKYGQQETLLINPQTNQPMQYFDVVMLDAKATLSKTFYVGAYNEGDNAAPDCSSEDGVHPVAMPGKQVIAPDCRACPYNVFGSKQSTDGQQRNSKACADTRKVAIVPSFNIPNENFGGPMLLRVPAASLGNLAQIARQCKAHGAPMHAVVIRVSFDYEVAYPKLKFEVVQFLSDAEFTQVMELRGDGRCAEVLNQGATVQAPALAAPVQGIPGQVPSAVAAAPAQPPVANSAPAPGFGPPVTAAPQQPVQQMQPPPAYQQPVQQMQPPPVQQGFQQAAPPPATFGPPAQAMQPPPVAAPAQGIPQQPPQPQQSYQQPMAPPPVYQQQAPQQVPPQGYQAPQQGFQQPQASFGPPPVQQAPQAPPPVQQAQAQAYPQQNAGPLPQAVLDTVDGMFSAQPQQ